MSDYEEENFCFYGKPLEQYDEDSVPKKKPIAVEDQIATDSHGRRRFHGAFTGGFSAGFFNTVGSLEGWTPSEFKSSRSEKQKHVVLNPEDFMDDEDMGEFGFAPQTIKATKEYDTSKKRKKKIFSDGPIPGEPVLHSLLTSGNETVGYMLLKNIGLKDKIKARNEEMESDSSKVYGCEMPRGPSEIPKSVKDKDYEIPEIYREYFHAPKMNTFGLGYVGLDKSHLNLFKSADLVVHEKNRKLQIRGQAFGVGAFENDDEDIYAKEDMSNYDFELTREKEKNQKQLKNSDVFGMFTKAKINTLNREIYPPPVIPKSFTGKHKVKKSRFEPVKEPNAENLERKNIDANHRAVLLGEETNQNATVSQPISQSISKSRKPSKSETPSEVKTLEQETTKDVAQKKTFDAKSLWDDRFVSAAQADETANILAPVEKFENDHYGKQMKEAARMKLFGPLTRISEDWQPCSLLCKRFNVPEPFADKPNTLKNRTKMKNLMFEYQKHHEENVLKPGLSHQKTTEVPTQNDVDVVEIKTEVVENENQETQEVDKIKVAKTENEISKNETSEDKVIDITDRLNVEEKIDLFKSVFSDTESEDEDEKVEETNENAEQKQHEEFEKFKAKVLSDELVLPRIKPVETGFFSGLDLKSIHSNKIVTEQEQVALAPSLSGDVQSNDHHNSYGPKLPDKLITEKSSSVILVDKSRSSSSDEWVEKDSLNETKPKKHKKHKSHKKKKSHHKSKKSKK